MTLEELRQLHDQREAARKTVVEITERLPRELAATYASLQKDLRALAQMSEEFGCGTEFRTLAEIIPKLPLPRPEPPTVAAAILAPVLPKEKEDTGTSEQYIVRKGDTIQVIPFDDKLLAVFADSHAILRQGTSKMHTANGVEKLNQLQDLLLDRLIFEEKVDTYAKLESRFYEECEHWKLPKFAPRHLPVFIHLRNFVCHWKNRQKEGRNCRLTVYSRRKKAGIKRLSDFKTEVPWSAYDALWWLHTIARREAEYRAMKREFTPLPEELRTILRVQSRSLRHRLR